MVSEILEGSAVAGVGTPGPRCTAGVVDGPASGAAVGVEANKVGAMPAEWNEANSKSDPTPVLSR